MNTKQSGLFLRIVLNLILITGLLLSIFASPQFAGAVGTIRYAISGGAVSGSCNSWGNGCELRYALALVAVSGDQIWVKAGTYKPTSGTDRSISFVLKNGVTIYGGFNGTETLLSQRNPAANVTILSGEIGVVGTSDNSLHVVIGSGINNTAGLDGFTITAGNATNDKGGGMWNYGGSPTLMNLIINANLAQYGGGMYNESNSSPALTNVTFSSNQTSNSGYGGGMYNMDSNPLLTNVTFDSNHTTGSFGYGGGMYNNNSNPTLTDVAFSGNAANYEAGGMENYYSSPTLTNVTFNANSAPYGGGMVNGRNSNSTLMNVTFNGNSASVLGGGIINSDYNLLTLTNVSFINNTVDGSGGGMVNGQNGMCQ